MQRRTEGRKLKNLPLLQPLSVVEAKFFPEPDVVVKKLRMPDGGEILTIDGYSSRDDKPILNEDFTYEDNSFLQKASRGSRMITLIPPVLSASEPSAIHNREVFTGMSRRALHCAYGTPEKVNDCGAGGKQFVYHGGRLLVYLDTSGKVADQQHLSF